MGQGSRPPLECGFCVNTIRLVAFHMCGILYSVSIFITRHFSKNTIAHSIFASYQFQPDVYVSFICFSNLLKVEYHFQLRYVLVRMVCFFFFQNQAQQKFGSPSIVSSTDNPNLCEALKAAKYFISLIRRILNRKNTLTTT